eukprot:4262792-Amphidinium_carterae.2
MRVVRACTWHVVNEGTKAVGTALVACAEQLVPTQGQMCGWVWLGSGDLDSILKKAEEIDTLGT